MNIDKIRIELVTFGVTLAFSAAVALVVASVSRSDEPPQIRLPCEIVDGAHYIDHCGLRIVPKIIVEHHICVGGFCTVCHRDGHGNLDPLFDDWKEPRCAEGTCKLQTVCEYNTTNVNWEVRR